MNNKAARVQLGAEGKLTIFRTQILLKMCSGLRPEKLWKLRNAAGVLRQRQKQFVVLTE